MRTFIENRVYLCLKLVSLEDHAWLGVDTADDVLEVLLRAVDVENALVNTELETVVGVATITARRFSRADSEHLGGHSAGSGSL